MGCDGRGLGRGHVLGRRAAHRCECIEEGVDLRKEDLVHVLERTSKLVCVPVISQCARSSAASVRSGLAVWQCRELAAKGSSRERQIVNCGPRSNTSW
eukprot:3867095-Rhodomonas_salina.2